MIESQKIRKITVEKIPKAALFGSTEMSNEPAAAAEDLSQRDEQGFDEATHLDLLIGACVKAAVSGEELNQWQAKLVSSLAPAYALYLAIRERDAAIEYVRQKTGVRGSKGRHNPELLCVQILTRPDDLRARKAASEYAALLRYAQLKAIEAGNFVDFAKSTTIQEAKRNAPVRKRQRGSACWLEMRIRRGDEGNKTIKFELAASIIQSLALLFDSDQVTIEAVADLLAWGPREAVCDPPIEGSATRTSTDV
ncbi:hypothetical protein G3545_13765 [Starkeya sp. ORNL1]|uniref:hypothetical protein n=1 Tax=Starkeya sp. ORNL1 TaxID=2709380 RepID=UPI00146295B1|nr:hypothetical protein [Starkeya sp. ORNL1]QJP14617.1 hypothetical protein G3545_13765 [Starkeya sp. ORNL1]